MYLLAIAAKGRRCRGWTSVTCRGRRGPGRQPGAWPPDPNGSDAAGTALAGPVDGKLVGDGDARHCTLSV